eukprot:4572271-Amphidinium_carterae.1
MRNASAKSADNNSMPSKGEHCRQQCKASSTTAVPRGSTIHSGAIAKAFTPERNMSKVILNLRTGLF